MDIYWLFFTEHWALSGAFIVLLILLLANEWRNRGAGSSSISPQELVGLMNHSRAAVIDIREKETFGQGHILGAMNMLQSEMENKKKMLNKYRSKPVIVVCQNGLSSSKARQWLLNEGFEEVYSLKGGIESWKTENLPISTR
jgi:rhodanese-related sulfurtransferase